MANTLIVYDEIGYILQQLTGDYYVPTGVPYLEVLIPDGKQLKFTQGIGVDVSVTPHQVILEDIPPTEIEQVKKQNELLKHQVDTTSLDLQAFMDFYFENGGV